MPRQLSNLDDLMREEEDRLAAEAATPARIAEDAATLKRTREKGDRELAALRASGGIEEPCDDDEDEDEDEE